MSVNININTPKAANTPSESASNADEQARQSRAAREKLGEEAEQLCADLERFFKRGFGDIPSANDLGELRGHQAMLRDLVQRASHTTAAAAACDEAARSHLAELTGERDKLKDAAARARADFLNYQARTQKDLDRAEELAVRGYAAEMLPVLDSLDLATQDIAKGQSDPKHLCEVIQLLDASVKQVLAVRGLQRIAAKGKPFDPALHEAIFKRPADKAAGEQPNQVAEEVRSGYLWNGLILRPAHVVVTEAEKSAK